MYKYYFLQIEKGKIIDIYILWYQGGGIVWWLMGGSGWGGGIIDVMMVIKELIGDIKLENENLIFLYL